MDTNLEDILKKLNNIEESLAYITDFLNHLEQRVKELESMSLEIRY